MKFKASFSSRRRQTRLLGKIMTLVGEHLGLSAELCFELEIAVVEAVNNAIIHACEDDPNHKLDMEICCRPDTITITLRDQGLGFDCFSQPSCPVPEDPSVEDLPESGFGLYLIHQVMDKVDYCSQSGINILTMKKNLSPAKDDDTVCS